MSFKPLDLETITDNPWKLIGKDWMLVTAGKPSSWNTMTASWGGVGVLWNRKVAFVFVRPSRHTFSFMERGDHFTLSFLPEASREILATCGRVSGRDTDKVKLTGLKPFEPVPGAVSFEQARLILVCRKLYSQNLAQSQAHDPSITENYPNGDWHRMFIADIESAWGNEG